MNPDPSQSPKTEPTSDQDTTPNNDQETASIRVHVDHESTPPSDPNDNSIESLELDPKKFPPGEGWTREVEIYLNNISQKCITFRNIHEKSAIYYTGCFNYFSLFLIFVSFVASVVTVIPIDHQQYNYITAIFTIFTSALATTNKFLKWQEMSTKHRIGSQKFLQLNENITSQILTAREKRLNGIQYIRWAGKTFNEIRKSLPFPPDKILIKLNVNDDSSTNPDIAIKDIYNQRHFNSSRINNDSSLRSRLPNSLKKILNHDVKDIDLENNFGPSQSNNIPSGDQEIQLQDFDDIEERSRQLQEYQLRKFKYNLQQFQT